MASCGPREVVNLAPGVERVLRRLEALESAQREDLVRQRSMEALVLAAAPGMMGRAVDERDTELEKPDPQSRRMPAGGVAPGASVVDEHRLRPAVALEGRLQMALIPKVLLADS